MSGIKSLRKELEKNFGEGIISFLDGKAQAREAYSTGVLSIDYGLVIGGYPKGYYIELYGKEGTGKTSLAVTCAAQVQKEGKFVLWLDYENSFDQIYFGKLGLQFGEEKFAVAYPPTLEDGFRIIYSAMTMPDVNLGMIVLDSLALAVPESDVKDLDERLGKQGMGSSARSINQILRQMTPIFTQRKDVSLLVLNQVRNVIGAFIPTQTTTGGLPLKFAAHIRHEIKRIGTIKVGGKAVGSRLKLKTVKSKVGVPLREVETDLIFGKGFDFAADAFGIAVTLGVVTKEKGMMYVIPGTDYKFRGAPGFREMWEGIVPLSAIGEAEVKKVGEALTGKEKDKFDALDESAQLQYAINVIRDEAKRASDALQALVRERVLACEANEVAQGADDDLGIAIKAGENPEAEAEVDEMLKDKGDR